MKLLFLFSLLLFQSIQAKDPVYDFSALQTRLEKLVAEFEGTAGIYVKHLKTGQEIAIHADTLFPSASIVKVPILVGVFDRIHSGAWSYDTLLTFYTDTVNYPGGDHGIISKLKEGSEIEMNKVAMLMITTSDNTGSLWLQQMVDGHHINDLMQDFGLEHVRVNSRTPGREDDRTRMGWGQLTPREITRLMIGIRNGEVISREASEEMYRVLTRIHIDGEALAFIPPWIQAASKQGAVNQSRAEVVIVNAPSGDYAFTVATKNQTDESWEYDNAGYVLIRKVSEILWNTFEPDYGWKPDYNLKKWW